MTAWFADYARVASRGRVTLPKGIRRYLGLEKGDPLMFVVTEGRVELRKGPEELPLVSGGTEPKEAADLAAEVPPKAEDSADAL